MEVEVRRQYHDNGNVLTECSYLNNIKQKLHAYHKNGALALQYQYNNGKIHGTAQAYSENNLRNYIITIKNEIFNGVNIIFDY